MLDFIVPMAERARSVMVDMDTSGDISSIKKKIDSLLYSTELGDKVLVIAI
jgi:hypothetical protein